MKSRILLLSAHMGQDHFGHALAQAYEQGARDGGAQIRLMQLNQMDFTPVLSSGSYYGRQDLEPDLRVFQENLSWCTHFCLIHPLWWGGMPAMLKGLFDRALLPGLAFQPISGQQFSKKLLTGRTARLLITSDTPSWFWHLFYGAGHHKIMKHQILGYVGIKLKASHNFAQMRTASAAQREKWLWQAQKRGYRDAG